MRIDIFAITVGGVAHARNMAADFTRRGDDCRVWYLEKYASADDFPAGTAQPLQKMADKVQEVFRQTDALIMICAVGIAVRMIAPLIADKRSDPAVVAIDDAGKFAVSILSGHIGGANDITRLVAAMINAVPVITTATDVNELPAFDTLAVKYDMAMVPFTMVKTGNAALVAGSPIYIYSDFDLPVKWPENVKVLRAHEQCDACDGGFKAVISCRKLGGEDYLQLIPKLVYAGIGCRRGVSRDEVIAAVAEGLRQAGLMPESLAGAASIDVKNDEEGLLTAAAQLGLAIRFYTSDELAAVEGCTASGFVQDTVGCPSVCEAAVMLAAGCTDNSKLLLGKTVVGRVTIALAAGEFPEAVLQ